MEPGLSRTCSRIMMKYADGNGPRVLVAENQPLTRMAAIDTLADAGFEVIAVMRGEDALALLDGHREVRAVITDIEMPGRLNGVALAETIASRWPLVGVVVVSGRENERNLPSSARFLQRPYAPGRLVDEVRGVMALPATANAAGPPDVAIV